MSWQLLKFISPQSWLSCVRRWAEECTRTGIRNQSIKTKHAARTGQREEHSQSDTLLTNMSDQNGVPRRDRFMKTAIFCSRTASPQTQYYPHAAWCYQTRQPFQDQTLSQNIQTTEIWTTISNFESQRTTRLSRSRLTDTQQPALCRTLSLIALETQRPALHVSSMSGTIGMFCVLKYCRQSCSSVCNFFSSISPASVLLWQWQVFTKISRSYFNKWHDLRSDQRLHFNFLFENISKETYMNKHFESSQKLLKSSFVNERFKKYSKVP